MSREIKSLPLHLRLLAEKRAAEYKAKNPKNNGTLVSGSFNWSSTPEGGDFWSNVNRGEDPSYLLHYTKGEQKEVYATFPHPDFYTDSLGSFFTYMELPVVRNRYWQEHQAIPKELSVVNWSDIKPKEEPTTVPASLPESFIIGKGLNGEQLTAIYQAHDKKPDGYKFQSTINYAVIDPQMRCGWNTFSSLREEHNHLPIFTFNEWKTLYQSKTMQQQPIGYILKDKNFVPVANAFLDTFDDFDGSHMEYWNHQGQEVNMTHDCDNAIRFKEAGLLDLWFNPVYKNSTPSFKAGDFVVVEDFGTLSWKGHFSLNKAYQLDKAFPSEGFHVSKDNEGSSNGWPPSDHMRRVKVRAATSSEIEAANTVVLTVGTRGSKVTIRNGSIRTRSTDVFNLDALETLLANALRLTLSLGSHVSSADETIRFIQVGCKEEGTMISIQELRTIIKTAKAQL